MPQQAFTVNMELGMLVGAAPCPDELKSSSGG